jgi:hypothetical protein
VIVGHDSAGRPAPGLLGLAVYAAMLLVPAFCAVLLPRLPAALGSHIADGSLVMLGALSGLMFCCFGVPLCRPAGNPLVCGVACGLVLGSVALPLLAALRLVEPLALATLIWLAAVLGCTAMGAAAASAAWGAAGGAVAVLVLAVPAVSGVFLADLLPAAAWLSGFSPLVAVRRLAESGGGAAAAWQACLSGLLLAVGACLRQNGVKSGRPGRRSTNSATSSATEDRSLSEMTSDGL